MKVHVVRQEALGDELKLDGQNKKGELTARAMLRTMENIVQEATLKKVLEVYVGLAQDYPVSIHPN